MSKKPKPEPESDPDDFLDHPDSITEEEADDEETQELRPLFPDGDPRKEHDWKKIFNA